MKVGDVMHFRLATTTCPLSAERDVGSLPPPDVWPTEACACLATDWAVCISDCVIRATYIALKRRRFPRPVTEPEKPVMRAAWNLRRSGCRNDSEWYCSPSSGPNFYNIQAFRVALKMLYHSSFVFKCPASVNVNTKVTFYIQQAIWSEFLIPINGSVIITFPRPHSFPQRRYPKYFKKRVHIKNRLPFIIERI